MVINMLRACLKILEKPGKGKIDCVKSILSETIEYLEKLPKNDPTWKSYIQYSNPDNLSRPSQIETSDLSPEAIAAKKDLLME